MKQTNQWASWSTVICGFLCYRRDSLTSCTRYRSLSQWMWRRCLYLWMKLSSGRHQATSTGPLLWQARCPHHASQSLNHPWGTIAQVFLTMIYSCLRQCSVPRLWGRRTWCLLLRIVIWIKIVVLYLKAHLAFRVAKLDCIAEDVI